MEPCTLVSRPAVAEELKLGDMANYPSLDALPSLQILSIEPEDESGLSGSIAGSCVG